MMLVVGIFFFFFDRKKEYTKNESEKWKTKVCEHEIHLAQIQNCCGVQPPLLPRYFRRPSFQRNILIRVTSMCDRKMVYFKAVFGKRNLYVHNIHSPIYQYLKSRGIHTHIEYATLNMRNMYA